MAKVTWTANAVDDLEQISKFIARDSLHYARIVVSKLYDAVDRLRKFPLSGRKVPEVDDPSLREIIIGGYRIIYRLKKSTIYILTIIHGRQNLFSSERSLILK